ncbi:MAG: hypothetical protein M3Y23_05510, partial [Actinomycetota bacterium]|nr:hypothetical protein [Actinomycetota bacterium]
EEDCAAKQMRVFLLLVGYPNEWLQNTEIAAMATEGEQPEVPMVSPAKRRVKRGHSVDPSSLPRKSGDRHG